jgi:hypothetical protein
MLPGQSSVQPLRELVAAGEKCGARECRHAVAVVLTAQARVYATKNGVKLVNEYQGSQGSGSASAFFYVHENNADTAPWLYNQTPPPVSPAAGGTGA